MNTTMNTMMEVPFKEVRQLISIAFRNASTRRTVKIRSRNSVTIKNFWDGGSRDETVLVDLSTDMAVSYSEISKNLVKEQPGPFAGMGQVHVTLEPRYAAIVHVIFQGKDLGYHVYLHPDVYKVLSKQFHPMG